MPLPYFVVDAFTDRPFAGNPAAVVPLDAWLPDASMAAIAAEMALAETAFFVPDGDDFRLRWMTPAVEVDLCGHATLATAHVLMRVLHPGRTAVRFHTRSGLLTVTAAGDGATLDFPARVPVRIDEPDLQAAVAAALGARGQVHHRLDDTLAAILARAKPGTSVLIMSNGGFGGIHERLLQALRAVVADDQ